MKKQDEPIDQRIAAFMERKARQFPDLSLR